MMKKSAKMGMAAVLLCGTQFFGMAQAATTINMHGVLTVKPCVVNSGGTVDVDFGDIDLQTLSATGTPYNTKDVPITLQCAYSVGTPMLTLTGATDSAPDGSIQTTKYTEGLIVYLLNNAGAPIAIGNPVDVASSVNVDGSGNGTLSLKAAVGRSQIQTGTLTPGAFSATANMTLIYQ